jgi:hypothetical protein
MFLTVSNTFLNIKAKAYSFVIIQPHVYYRIEYSNMQEGKTDIKLSAEKKLVLCLIKT